MTKENEKYLINGEKSKWEVVIGLEVHAQVTSNSKLFSGSSTKFGAEPNTQVSLVDSAFRECYQLSMNTAFNKQLKLDLV